jgi:hypothetical protein
MEFIERGGGSVIGVDCPRVRGAARMKTRRCDNVGAIAANLAELEPPRGDGAVPTEVKVIAAARPHGRGRRMTGANERLRTIDVDHD